MGWVTIFDQKGRHLIGHRVITSSSIMGCKGPRLPVSFCAHSTDYRMQDEHQPIQNGYSTTSLILHCMQDLINANHSHDPQDQTKVFLCASRGVIMSRATKASILTFSILPLQLRLKSKDHGCTELYFPAFSISPVLGTRSTNCELQSLCVELSFIYLDTVLWSLAAYWHRDGWTSRGRCLAVNLCWKVMLVAKSLLSRDSMLISIVQLEGIMTYLLSISSLVFLFDFPETALQSLKSLNGTEASFA